MSGSGERIDDALVAVGSADSTQRLARAIVEGLGTVADRRFTVLAHEQTGGRGRRGRGWSSPRDRGVYATVVRPAERAQLVVLPLLAGAAVCAGLRRLGAPARLKWPNDVLLGDDKVAGVLIETAAASDGSRAALIGVGVNLTHRREELPRPDATSLALFGCGSVGAATAAGVLVAALDRELSAAGRAGYAVARFEELAAHRKGDVLTVTVDDRTVVGTYLGLDANGRLELEAEEGVLRLSTADVVRVARGGERC